MSIQRLQRREKYGNAGYRMNRAAICGHRRMGPAGSGAKEKLPCKTMDLSASVCYTESGLNKAQIVYKVK
jgi:hypothetical protein